MAARLSKGARVGEKGQAVPLRFGAALDQTLLGAATHSPLALMVLMVLMDSQCLVLRLGLGPQHRQPVGHV